MSESKIVEAMAAIDHSGKWIIYGFDELKTIGDLHDCGVTEDLEEPIRYAKVRVTLFLPSEPQIEVLAGATMSIDETQV